MRLATIGFLGLAGVLQTGPPVFSLVAERPLAVIPAPAPAGTSALPAVSVWYRGVPAGIPRQDDLAAIRALGFLAVTWPSQFTATLPDLRRMAAIIDLVVDVRTPPRFLTEAGALAPAEAIDVSVAGSSAAIMPALVWRAVAHGARRVAFDAGFPTGAGIDRPNATWIRPATALARQLSANATMFAELADVPALTIESPPDPHLDVVLRQTTRAWVLIASNTDRVGHRLVSRLPAGVPSAMWVSLIDGDGMSMLDLPDGARWTVDLAPGEARAYVIDKVRRADRSVRRADRSSIRLTLRLSSPRLR